MSDKNSNLEAKSTSIDELILIIKLFTSLDILSRAKVIALADKLLRGEKNVCWEQMHE